MAAGDVWRRRPERRGEVRGLRDCGHAIGRDAPSGELVDRVRPVSDGDTDQRAELLAIVRRRGYRRLPEAVQLSSGEWSRDFIDAKRALAHGVDLGLACRALAERLADAGIDFDAIGGLTLGADQFAHGTAIVAGKRWFVVRKQAKGRGTDQLIEGAALHAGVRAVLVDDVVTTGGSIRHALEVVQRTGADVVAAVTLVDRGEVARRFFAGAGVPYIPLLTYSDLGIDPVGGKAGRDPDE